MALNERYDTVSLPPGAAADQPLRRVSRGVNRDNIDYPPGAHDDLANAVAGALVLARTRPARVGRPGPPHWLSARAAGTSSRCGRSLCPRHHRQAGVGWQRGAHLGHTLAAANGSAADVGAGAGEPTASGEAKELSG